MKARESGQSLVVFVAFLVGNERDGRLRGFVGWPCRVREEFFLSLRIENIESSAKQI